MLKRARNVQPVNRGTIALFVILALAPGEAFAQDAGAAAGTDGVVAGPVVRESVPDASLTTQGAETARPDARTVELEWRLSRLEAEIAARKVADQAAQEAARKKPKLISAEPGKGITIQDEKGRSSMTIRPRVQIRDTVSKDKGADATNEINVRTLRFVVFGTVLDPALKYFVQLAFGSGDYEKDNASPIFDAFIESTHIRDLNVRVGQFFVPFDRARTTREFGLQFVDRQNVVRELSLDRDVGIMFSSNDFLGQKGRLGYHLFAGGGEGRNRFGGQKVGPLVVGRLVARPFGPFDDDLEGDLTRDKRARLAVGVAGAYNSETNRPSSTFGTPFTLGTTNYAHAAVDAVFKLRGFSFFAEALYRRANTDHLDGVVDTKPVREWTRTGYGYFTQAGMMVEKRVEIVARWEQLFVDTTSDPAFLKTQRTLGKQVGGGANLYLNGHFFKIQADYFYQFGDHPSDGRHVARLQLDATF